MKIDYLVKDGVKFYPVYSKRQWYVSRHGSVIGATGNILKPKSQGNYLVVSYSTDDGTPKKTRHQYVHRLVAKAFIPNPNNCRCVNHIDGDKLNNAEWNLEWVTHSENHNHAIESGLVYNIPTKGQQGFQCGN